MCADKKRKELPPEKKALNLALKKALDDKGISNAKVASHFEKSEAMVSNWFRLKTGCPITKAKQIVKHFGLNEAAVFGVNQFSVINNLGLSDKAVDIAKEADALLEEAPDEFDCIRNFIRFRASEASKKCRQKRRKNA